jgi:thiol-disulfide isomerase/thioredoxin
MRRLLFSLGIIWLTAAQSQEVAVVKFSELQKKILTADAKITVFNFWATWCGPCVKEIPHFESYSEKKDVKIYLVSLDFEEDLDKVKKFVVNKGLKTEVLFLNEKNYNTFMDKVSKEWTGAIPATLFVDQWGKTYFHEKAFTKEELDQKINSYLD